MLFTLLDVLVEEPGILERNCTPLIIIAVAALLGLVIFFIWKRKKRNP
jgi:LPXTG-motif cell wall-anchored protein